MTTNYSRAERVALCDLLEQLGPDAPTLCEGWTTYDLAAHLVARERRPDSGPGLLFKPLAGWTEKVRQQQKDHPYPQLLHLIRSGPPPWSPFGMLPSIDAVANTVEFLVHHEDVRRAQPGWEPRDLEPAFEEVLWQRLRGAARLLFRGVPVGVILHWPDGRTATVRTGSPVVELTGKPSELLLYASGRRAHARVELAGPAEARQLLEDVDLRL
ncbi:TIGR03085 family protein [Carbonactinospora thermoautotrophica]|uniref:Uncharacterized protein n=1 Tax=Carbonactinospora thermoautotrophica TaxID=1469144 RepID=A0A132NIN5_9ACTN|nr:TIGR03085 family metal-binding protein [Carbonactinospora thermoautotrophica]KWW99843.1 hypothetical protein LI90_1482 [Carbonactinospora thermoautotrophica]KWX04434.1 hypothetical protein TH66_07560 [Carbonactinospora thermoautotrophica]KWX09979.1 hypothetical protein TR74_06405 [Carbonactinospora thermoautotrophica]MCX9191167.1 TIGR03085 family protein [Carbonactinospora thermoautotrophica]